MEKMNAEVFLTVARLGSFRKAADVLGYTQAGVSYIIGAMEEEIGLALFIRERAGVKLSPEGKALLPQIKELAKWESQFKQKIDELNGLEKGSVRVQIFDSISIHWMPGILRDFKDDYPGINVELISEEDNLEAERRVMKGEVDCGFFWTKVNPKIETIPLMEENLMAVIPPEHPLASEETFPVEKLGDYPYIAMKYDSHTGIDEIFLSHGLEPNSVFRMDNDFAAMAMVSKNLGYCIMPELLLQDVPYDVYCLEFDEPQKRTISIGTNSLKSCSKACQKFIEYTRNWAARNVE